MSTDPFARVSLGDERIIQKTISESDVYLYAGIVGDFHPNHVNAPYAEEKLGARVVHGALLPGFVSRCTVELLGERLSPPGYAAQSFSIKCVAPVFIGDTISVRVRITDLQPERRKVIMEAEISNQHGTLCALGDTVVKVLRNKPETSQREIQ
ncbi:enoyl-CoA hydratase [Pseudomonas daroniae]|uniref:Enoyl-CoA hydratase n=1 Tax=Phytopseudomonas daroniae TaxID=2487519 RepID=A0A4V6MX25_9GAMM|nr:MULTISPECIES: MaoC family dehydratase [Pseudomonas]TBU76343.1 enoyl-CoA hydratase [Pseudomonas daroniae]TBU76763.1 enoyl-CoA hydratase [Pseudomonas daroniae]TBU81334.1 enoyl-CoA hydratase [Pseudomonas sp. FRB 228]TBU90459.1 enoyl-CoA hydratase [Pseudomonas daroniae]